MTMISGHRRRVIAFGLMCWLTACGALAAAGKPGYFRIALPSGDTIMVQIQGSHLRVGATMEALNAGKQYKGQSVGSACSFRLLDLPVASNALPAGCVRLQIDNLRTITPSKNQNAFYSMGTLILHYPDNFGALWTYHTEFSVQLTDDPEAASAVRLPTLDKISPEVILRPGDKKVLGVGIRIKAENTVLEDIRLKNKSIEVGLTLTDPKGKTNTVKPSPALSQMGFG